MIEFKDVCVSYTPEAQVLAEVNFTINNGEFVAFVGSNGAGKSTIEDGRIGVLLGPNGAGKSTTMRLMNGLLKPNSGEVLIDGIPTTQLKTSEIAHKVGFLFQNPDRQICCKTVREELEFGFKAQGALDDEARARVDEVIEEFGFNANAEPYLLNRGTRQLLALASIIVMAPQTIILDEPTTGLDYRECCKVMEAIEKLHKSGKTIVMVCHDMEVVADFADRVIVMTYGEMVADGPTFDILRNSEIIAPQIISISQELVARNPELAHSSIAQANSLQELTNAIEAFVVDKGGK